MSKPDAKRRYRRRRAARALRKRYPFLDHVPFMANAVWTPERVQSLQEKWDQERDNPRPRGPTIVSPAVLGQLRKDMDAVFSKRLAEADPMSKRLFPIGDTVRFTPIVDGKIGAPLYPCTVCGKCENERRGMLCGDCTPLTCM